MQLVNVFVYVCAYISTKEEIKMSEKGGEKERERIGIKIYNVSNKIENVNHKSMNKSLIYIS